MLYANWSCDIKALAIVISAFIGLVAGFIMSPDLAGYPFIATEEQLHQIRVQEIKEYLLVGAAMGLFSGCTSMLVKSKLLIPYPCIVFVVLAYISFEAYRVEGVILVYHFLFYKYFSFIFSSFFVCGCIQLIRRRRAIKSI